MIMMTRVVVPTGVEGLTDPERAAVPVLLPRPDSPLVGAVTPGRQEAFESETNVRNIE